MSEVEKVEKERTRDTAHLWADKRIPRFFKKQFDRKWSRRLRDVYFTLCEVDSDFNERKHEDSRSLPGLIDLCCSYSGMDTNTVVESLRVLSWLGLIHYGRRHVGGKIAGSFLYLYQWMGEEYHIQRIRDCVNEEGLKLLDTFLGNPLIRVFPYKGISYNIKNVSKDTIDLKNVSKDTIDLKESFQRKEGRPDGRSPSRLLRLSRSENIKLQLTDPKVLSLVGKKAPTWSVNVSQKILDLIDHWNSTGARKHLRTGTRVYQYSVSYLRGLLSGGFFKDGPNKGRKFTEQQIVSVFTSFKNEIVNSGGRRLRFLRSFSLPDFVLNINGKSLFLEFLDGKKHRREEDLLPDPNPIITSVFKKMWKDEVLGGVQVKHSNFEENKFRRGTMAALEFKKDHGRKIVGINGDRDYAEEICRALQDSYGEKISKMELGAFSSDRTWHKLVPSFFNSQGSLEREWETE